MYLEWQRLEWRPFSHGSCRMWRRRLAFGRMNDEVNCGQGDRTLTTAGRGVEMGMQGWRKQLTQVGDRHGQEVGRQGR